MKRPAIKKLYYSIGEVSRITALKPYVLRYWESEFQQLRPAKNRAGNRIYRNSDIELILLIKKLLYAEKFTIEGAKKRLKEHRKSDAEKQLKISFIEDTNDNIIKQIRQELLDILQLLEDHTHKT